MKKLLGGLVLSLVLSLPAWAAVDMNAATLSELEAVKGIGPAKARAILEYRNKNGPFKRVDDLAKVKGFGTANVARLKSELKVGSMAEKAKPEPHK